MSEEDVTRPTTPAAAGPRLLTDAEARAIRAVLAGCPRSWPARARMQRELDAYDAVKAREMGEVVP